MNEKLEILKQQVHQKGFNISMMINCFKKKQVEAKSLRIVPEEVYCEVCLDYLKRHDIVNKSFPYFLKVLNLKADQYAAKLNIQESDKNKFGAMPENIKDIMRRSVA